MNTSSRRSAIKWLVGTLLLEPMLASAKHTMAPPREMGMQEKCSVLFSKLLPHDAEYLTSVEEQGVFAAIYESPEADMPASFQSRVRWLCLAVKTDAGSFEIQASADVLLPHSDVHPIDVTLAITRGSVEVAEDKVRGNAFQRWTWSGSQWVLAQRRTADVFHDEWTEEEYNAEESKVVVSKGKIYLDDAESVVQLQRVSQVDIAHYDGGSLAA